MHLDFQDDIVIRSVAETAVYINPSCDVVIRQERFNEADSVVIIPVESVSKLISALKIAKRNALESMEE